ncbi:MAG: D-alanyl-D-alanine carboxypeptidase, partial [Butyrivibrio sp.]
MVILTVLAGESKLYAAEGELKLYAKSAVLIDGSNGRILYGKNENSVMPMASTTKVMTLIMALEYGDPDDTVTISGYAAMQPDVQLN